jgi:hypothetical protein
MRQDTDMKDLRSTMLSLPARVPYGMSLGSIALCIVLWIRAKTIGEDERGNAERRALFAGLWPPMFWLIGDTLARGDQDRSLKWGSRRGILARVSPRSWTS